MPLASTIYRRKGRRRLQCRSSAVAQQRKSINSRFIIFFLLLFCTHAYGKIHDRLLIVVGLHNHFWPWFHVSFFPAFTHRTLDYILYSIRHYMTRTFRLCELSESRYICRRQMYCFNVIRITAIGHE